jgi:hypothetical protein
VDLYKAYKNKPKHVKHHQAAVVLFLCVLIVGGSVWYAMKDDGTQEVKTNQQENNSQKNSPLPSFEKVQRPTPAPVSMDRVKKQGCVADGLLSEYNPDYPEFASLINRSQCYYLHRAIETWLKPPDFDTINYEMGQITKKDVVYGMFIAEALDTHAQYRDQDSQTDFDFSQMCRDGSANVWGMHTCKPDMASSAYRDYLKYITHKAIDLGVQSFTFGQIYWQDSPDRKYAAGVVKDIRDYAKSKNVDVIIGAQTGSITDPNYLKLFDFIEGGVGIDDAGNIENGPCLSSRGGCWALLWNNIYASKAKNVLLDLDWTGIPSDDLDRFARMDQQTRQQTLANLYDYFNSKNMGFMMPYFGVLYGQNGGCYGPKKKFYSPDMKYGCKDEKTISGLLSGEDVAFKQ